MPETTDERTWYQVPQDKLRITATYRGAAEGETTADGQPESVEIIVNDDIGTGTQATAYIASLVDSLFRRGAGDYEVHVDLGEQSTLTTEQITAGITSGAEVAR